MKSIFLFAGEISADLYGGLLLPQLQKLLPHAAFWGVGGPKMQEHGFETLIDMQAFQVMGFSDVLFALPRLIRSFYAIKRAILQKQPDIVITIDQPGFGMRLAKSLRRAGYKGKLVQYVAPTVWAYKPKRADIMAHSFDLLLTLFDFEAQYFAHTPLKTVFVGHPIVELIGNPTPVVAEPIVALFPGSRPAEVTRNLQKQLDAALLFQKSHPEFKVAIVVKNRMSGLPREIMQVPFVERYELMQRATLAIAKSGTVTLELALHQVPTVVTYELSRLNYLMAKYILRLNLSHFCIVNILSQKEIFFEQIYPPVTPQSIAQCLEAYHQHPERTAPLEDLKKRLTPTTSPSQTAAEAIYGLL